MSQFILIGDHAGNAVPSALGALGISDAAMRRHIAWDIGIAGLGEKLSSTLDAVFITQVFSRLVIDCNREPGAVDAMPEISDSTHIRGNHNLTAFDRAARVSAIHTPYHTAIAQELARRDVAGLMTILVSLHSFTPKMGGFSRPWQVGVLYSGGDASFAVSTLRHLEAYGNLLVGDNQPYAMDSIDYTVPRHAFDARRPYVEIEVRQDLVVSSDTQAEWAEILAKVLLAAAGSDR